MNDELKVGDPVRLKSGGSRMTIRLIGDELSPDNVHCQWFDPADPTGEVREGCFPKASLELSDGAEPTKPSMGFAIT